MEWWISACWKGFQHSNKWDEFPGKNNQNTGRRVGVNGEDDDDDDRMMTALAVMSPLGNVGTNNNNGDWLMMLNGLYWFIMIK